ncbi:hypothetical protein M9458_026455, partial [Cirrhinus mrigala]
TSEQMHMLPYFCANLHTQFVQYCQRCLGSQERPLVSYTTRHNVSVPSIRERGLPYVTETFSSTKNAISV